MVKVTCSVVRSNKVIECVCSLHRAEYECIFGGCVHLAVCMFCLQNCCMNSDKTWPLTFSTVSCQACLTLLCVGAL